MLCFELILELGELLMLPSGIWLLDDDFYSASLFWLVVLISESSLSRFSEIFFVIFESFNSLVKVSSGSILYSYFTFRLLFLRLAAVEAAAC